MHPIRKILVAVRDPRAKRLPAVEKAAQLAQAFEARIELFHALSIPIPLDTETFGTQLLYQLENAHRVQLRSGLEALAESVRKRGIEVTTQALWDFPAGEAIVRRAATANADLIVAECHAGEHRGRWFLHLTDWDLLRHAAVPVLLVKNKRPYRRPALLAAVDPSHAFAKPAKLDVEILRTAQAFTRKLRGKLHAVHAYVPVPGDATGSELLNPAATRILSARAKTHARARYEPLLKSARITHVTSHLIDEHPINGLPRLARQIGCDILVMGAVSRSGLRRIFIGNTAERILDEVECDVLVVKPPGFMSKLSRPLN
jgi:universal stress protein E